MTPGEYGPTGVGSPGAETGVGAGDVVMMAMLRQRSVFRQHLVGIDILIMGRLMLAP